MTRFRLAAVLAAAFLTLHPASASASTPKPPIPPGPRVPAPGRTAIVPGPRVPAPGRIVPPVPRVPAWH